jgi:hypothetical protein
MEVFDTNKIIRSSVILLLPLINDVDDRTLKHIDRSFCCVHWHWKSSAEHSIEITWSGITLGTIEYLYNSGIDQQTVGEYVMYKRRGFQSHWGKNKQIIQRIFPANNLNWVFRTNFNVKQIVIHIQMYWILMFPFCVLIFCHEFTH